MKNFFSNFYTSFFVKPIRILLILWFLVFSFLWFYKFNTLPSNLDWDGIIAPKVAASPELMKNGIALLYPLLYVKILSLIFILFGPSVSLTIFTSTLIGFLTVLGTILFGKIIYKKEKAAQFFLFAFLPLSLLALFCSRTGSPYIMMASAYLVILFLAFLSLKNKLFLLLAGVAWGIFFLNSYHSLLLLPIIIFFFLLFSQGKNFFSYIPYIFGFLILGAGTFLILVVWIEESVGIEKFTFIRSFYKVFFIDRIEYSSGVSGIYSFFDRIILQIKNLFVSFEFLERYQPDEPITFIEGYSFFHSFVSLMFFVGLIKFIFSKRTDFEKLLFFWIVIPLGFYAYVSLSSTRYILQIFPAIFLFAASGFNFLYQKISSYLKCKKVPTFYLWLVIIFCFGLNLISSWNGYYIVFKNRDYKIFAKQFGQRQLVRYFNSIIKESEAQDVLVIMDDNFYYPLYEFYFENKNVTQTLKWSDFKAKILIIQSKNKGDIFDELKVSKIFVSLFDNSNIHGGGFLGVPNIEEFLTFFPEVSPMMPEKVVLSANGSPALVIYALSKTNASLAKEIELSNRQSSGNLITNGSFENGVFGWSERVLASGEYIKTSVSSAITNDDKRKGKYSLRLNASSNFNFVSQRVEGLKENTWYKFSCWFKSNKGIPVKVEILGTADKNQLLKKNFVAPNFINFKGWNYREEIFFNKNNTAAELKLYSGDFRKDGTFYFNGDTIVTIFDEIILAEYENE